MGLERVDCKANLEPKWPQVFKLQRNYPPTLPGQGLLHGARLLHPHYVFIETINVPYGHSPYTPPGPTYPLPTQVKAVHACVDTVVLYFSFDESC